ncbi:hypothetical protein scyTo_0026315, partial [Scyliorhinus torazame]|nr:hypothetical protein [Scyliorhinus torazame]
TVSNQQESESQQQQPPTEGDDTTRIFLEDLAENGKRLADQAIGTVLELLSDSNKMKLKHIAK